MSKSVGAGFTEIDERIDYFVKYAAIQNFGDYLPELFCKNLLTYPRIDADIFRLVGSVIDDRWIRQDLGRRNGHVTGLIAFWGCGKRDATPLSPETAAHCRFFGVRGALSRDALGLPLNTVLGDPGLLAPLFHTPRPHPQTRGRTICIPHIHDMRSREEILALSGAEILIHPEIEASERAMLDILDSIASADFILSASLHGAIIACAYGKPFAFWDNGHLDVPFKWDDFASSIGIEAEFARSLDEGRALYEKLAPRIKVPPLTPILDICPLAPQPTAMLRALAHDNIADREILLKAAAILEAATPNAEDSVHALFLDSAANRASRATVSRLVKRKAGLSARTLKLKVRNALGMK